MLRFDYPLNQIPASWQKELSTELSQNELDGLKSFLDQEYNYPDLMSRWTTVPRKEHLFEALKGIGPSDIKVVILGQDPYPALGVANGIAFSSQSDNPIITPTLERIFSKLESDLKIARPLTGYLGSWRDNGVLLLNSALTCKFTKRGADNAEEANDIYLQCSLAAWRQFIEAVIHIVSNKSPEAFFMLWGSAAISFEQHINGERSKVIKSSHPSPKSCDIPLLTGEPAFSATHPFAAADEHLGYQINWSTDC